MMPGRFPAFSPAWEMEVCLHACSALGLCCLPAICLGLPACLGACYLGACLDACLPAWVEFCLPYILLGFCLAAPATTVLPATACFTAATTIARLDAACC